MSGKFMKARLTVCHGKTESVVWISIGEKESVCKGFNILSAKMYKVVDIIFYNGHPLLGQQGKVSEMQIGR